MLFIDRERGMLKGVKKLIKGGFDFRGVGDFTLHGRSRHFYVIVSGLGWRRAGECGLQTDIGGCGADSFSNTIRGGNIPGA